MSTNAPVPSQSASDKLADTISQQVVAPLICRIVGSKITSIAGVLSAAAACLGSFAPFVPTKDRIWVVFAGTMFGSISLALAKDTTK